jgi:hypothetical protein
LIVLLVQSIAESLVYVCVGGSICDIYNSECASSFHVITNISANLAINGYFFYSTLSMGKVYFYPSIFLAWNVVILVKYCYEPKIVNGSYRLEKNP